MAHASDDELSSVASDVEEEEEEEEVTDLSVPSVVTKYKAAADIVNRALQGVITQCVAGKSVVEVCSFGDELITKQCQMVYKSKHIEKGIAFPTCVSVNNCVCHYSPLPGESTSLAAGDMVKIDLGCHIDGYISVVAHTLVVPGEESAAPLTGARADVLLAAHKAMEVALRLVKPGGKNSEVTAAIKDVAEAFGVTPMQGGLSHQMKRFVIDGNKVIIQREETEQHVEEITFEPNEVYGMDIAFSTGEGKPREEDCRTTVFKRAVENTYRLKMKASRYVFNEVNEHHSALPFSLRAIGDERQARMGVVECVKHELLHPYPVLFEKADSEIAHLKCTFLLMPSGTLKITGLALPEGYLESDKTLPPELAALAASSTKKKSKSRRRKKKKAAAAAAAAPAAAE
jgi:curved DNA binding protein